MTFTFPIAPREANLFQPVSDVYGLRLALVFGNEFAGGRCPFHAKQCYHCDIGSGEGVPFTSVMNQERLAFFQQHYAAVLPDVAHLVVYNSGSVLNRREMSEETLGAILAFAAALPVCQVISFDSREPYITDEQLAFLDARLRPDQQPRVILGIESQDDAIRIGTLQKRMTRPAIAEAVATIARHPGMGLDVNIVVQPPTLVGDAAVAEAVKTVEYGLELARQHSVSVDFNIHPYYPSQRGRAAFPDHPRADLTVAMRAVDLMAQRIAASGLDAHVFIGWQDEQHDQEQDLRHAELAALGVL